MKQRLASGLKPMVLIILTAISSAYVFAQEKKIDVEINTKVDFGGFLLTLCIWVGGGTVFSLLLVALLRSGSNKA